MTTGKTSPVDVLGPQQPREQEPAHHRLRVAALRNYGTVGILVALVIIFWATAPQFMTLRNMQNVLIVETITAMMTFGVMFPLIVGEFDLSVGYLIGFIAVLGAYLAGHRVSTLLIILVMVLGSTLIGVINGLLTQRARISSFIATLGVGIVLQGFTQGTSGGKVLFNNIPHFVLKLGGGYAGPLAISVWITLGFAIVLFYVLEYTPVGRSWYAVGGAERVAFLAGLRTGRLKVAAFALSGLMVGVAAIFALGQSGSANPGFGPDLLLPAYAAAFLGVTTYRAGHYNVVGSVVGILLLAIGFNGLSLWGVPFWVQPIFNGGVLLVAVMAARAEARRVKVGA